MRLRINLALSAILFATGAAAVPCAVCPSSIFFNGATRTLTTIRQDTGNTVACSYNTPPISGFSPACLFRNVDGVLTFANTGGSCPSVANIAQKTTC